MPDRTPYQKTRQYLFTPNQVRMAVALGTVGMIVTIVVLLFLASAHPQGNFQALDDSQFQQHLADATADISGYSVDGDRATIDINRAIELVAERGVQNPGFYVAGAAPATPAAPAAEGEADAAAEAGAEPAGETAAAAELPDGAAAYEATCAACHQGSGQGIPGGFPPLAGHAPELYAADRDLIPTTILFGLQGPITVDGMPYNSVMTPQGHLSDAEIAAIANHIMTAWGNDALAPDFEPYEAAEVEALRAQALSMTDVHELRTAAGLD